MLGFGGDADSEGLLARCSGLVERCWRLMGLATEVLGDAEEMAEVAGVAGTCWDRLRPPEVCRRVLGLVGRC